MEKIVLSVNKMGRIKITKQDLDRPSNDISPACFNFIPSMEQTKRLNPVGHMIRVGHYRGQYLLNVGSRLKSALFRSLKETLDL